MSASVFSTQRLSLNFSLRVMAEVANFDLFESNISQKSKYLTYVFGICIKKMNKEVSSPSG